MATCSRWRHFPDDRFPATGPFVGRSNREDWWFFGSGPNSLGDIPPIEPVRDE